MRLALERLKRKHGLEVDIGAPKTPYKETILKPVTQHARHKKQSGGHGQFGDVTVEIVPQPRGAGFSFAQKITGGVVPKQWIPAVEQGIKDALSRGPLGFPVVDVATTLVDGGYHSVDSSEMAFRTAGRLAMEEGMRACGSCLLEPIEKLSVYAPSTSTSHVTSALSARRGQILGFGPREGWPGWDQIDAYLPRAERMELIGELRSVTQGLGSYEASVRPHVRTCGTPGRRGRPEGPVGGVPSTSLLPQSSLQTIPSISTTQQSHHPPIPQPTRTKSRRLRSAPHFASWRAGLDGRRLQPGSSDTKLNGRLFTWRPPSIAFFPPPSLLSPSLPIHPRPIHRSGASLERSHRRDHEQGDQEHQVEDVAYDHHACG